MLKTLKDAVVGQDRAVAELAAILEPVARPTAWARPIVPIAVVGPTATGKATLVRAAAKSVGASLLEFDGSAFSATELRDHLRNGVTRMVVSPTSGPFRM